MPRGSKLTKEQIDFIIERTNGNAERYAIAEDLGINVKTVTKYQQLLGLTAACHRTRRNGREQIPAPPEFTETKIPEATKKNKYETDALIVAEKTVTIVGAGTNFVYKLGTKSEEIIIETGYNESPIKIDIRDVVGMAKELVQIAYKLDTMKKEILGD